MAEAKLAIDVRNALGDGPLWHMLRERLIWFDVLNHCMFMAKPDGSELVTYGFGEPVSAAFPQNREYILVAGASGLWRVNMDTNSQDLIVNLENHPDSILKTYGRKTEGNSLWIGTSPRNALSDVGVLYLARGGEDEQMFAGKGIPSAICMTSDGRRGYFCLPNHHLIMTCGIDPDTGLPMGKSDVFVDMSADRLVPDGAVVDSAGFLWVALNGAGRVVRYAPSGVTDTVVDIPAPMTTCVCFGGKDLLTLFVTTAARTLSPEAQMSAPLSGAVFAIELKVPGIPEPLIRG